MAYRASDVAMLIGPDGRGALVDRETAQPLLAPGADHHRCGPMSSMRQDRRGRRRTPDFIVRGRMLDLAV